MSKNRYTRALKHLKNKTIDEKLELLTELPTNHTTGLYVDVPGGEVTPPPVPGPIDSPADYSQDGDGAPGYEGKDTTGLFMTDGTIKTVEPPGDTSYILGPMSSMWYAWANYTQIGYIRQEDRKMVNLGRITGQLDDWDEVSGFTDYGQLTLEQAVWFKNITRINDYRAFYPGPPSSVADEYGRYICSITGESKPAERQPPTNFEPGTQRGGNPSDNFSLAMDRGGTAIGIGIALWMLYQTGEVIKNLDELMDKLSPEEKERLFDNHTSQFGDTNAAAAAAEQNIGYEMASARGPYGTPGADKPYVRRGYKDKDGKFVDFDNPATWPSIVPKPPRASSTTNTMVAHYIAHGHFIKEQASGGGTITAHTEAGDVTINIPSSPPMPPEDDGGMRTTPQGVDPLTDYSKNTLNWLKSQSSEYFVSGYIQGTEPAELEKMFAGTTIKWYQVSSMVSEIQETRKAQQEAQERYNEHWDLISPQLDSLLAQMSSIAAGEVNYGVFYGQYLPLANRVDALWAEHDQIFVEIEKLAEKRLTLSGQLGRYVQSGKIVDMDPFKLNDPTIKKEKELDEKEINDLINELKKAASDAKKSAALNKLKAFGYGALLAAGAVVGFKLLTGAAAVKSLGVPVVNTLKKLAPKVTKTVTKPFQNASDDFVRAITDPKTMSRAQDAVSKAPKGFKNDVAIEVNVGGVTKRVGAADILRFKGFQVNSHQPSGKLLTENQKRILREIKKPVVIDEGPTKFKVKPTGRKNKSVGSTMMNKVETPVTYKPIINIWSKKDKMQNIRASQEKKNQVLELVGAAEHHWTYLTEDRRKKKQEKVNEILSLEYDKALELMYENYKKSIDGKAEKLVNKIRTKVKPEYPETPPPQLDPETGMHPKYGKKYKHDKLDPHSAESMPPTGDPVIDANAKKAHDPVQKARKLKILRGKSIKEETNWSKVSNRIKKLTESDWSPVDTGRPTNSTTQTFEYGGEGGPRFTANGLGGQDVYPQTIDFFGDQIPTPSYSNLALQGYTPPLGKGVMKRDAGQNKVRIAEIEERLNELTSKRYEVESDFYEKWNKIKKELPPLPKSLAIYTRLDPVRVLATADSLTAEETSYLKAQIKYEKDFESAKKNDLSKKFDDIRKEREALEKEYNYLLGLPSPILNNQLDASQDYTVEIDADAFMGGRVDGESPDTPTFADTINNKPNRVDGESPDTPIRLTAPGGKNYQPGYVPYPNPNNYKPVSADEIEYVNSLQTLPALVNVVSTILGNNEGSAATPADWALQYARGDYTPITKSPGRAFNQHTMELISAALNDGIAPRGSVKHHTYRDSNLYDSLRDANIRNSLGEFNYRATANGIEITDTFNFSGNTSIGALEFVDDIIGRATFGMVDQPIQRTADNLVDIGYRSALEQGENPADDKHGIPIKYTIPWNEVPAELQNQLDPTATTIPTIKRARKGKSKSKTFENFDNLSKKKIYEDIAIKETKYLRYFIENSSVPKHYDWESGEFNELAEINRVVLKRLETIENALSEGMTTKDFKYLYGGVITNDIVSLNPNLVSSTFAHDLISTSSEVTSHMFGPDFPGSHINSIGDFNPQSYSKVDVVATASWNSIQDVTPSGWTPEYVDSVSDVVTPGQESDVFKDTLFGVVTVNGTNFSVSSGDDYGNDNTVDIEDLRTLFPGVTFPEGHPTPGQEVNEPPIEGSMLLRTFKSVKVGQEITFNYSFTSTETEEDDDVTYRGETRPVPGDDGNMDDYAFVLIAGKVQKIVSVLARDGNNLDFNFQDQDDYYKPDILQSRFPLTGKYSYTVKQDDIDDHGNLKLFVGVMDTGDGAFGSDLDVTNFKLDSSRLAAGQLGKTTDAYNLGTSVASLDPNNKKKKKDRKEDRKKKKNTFAERWGLPNDYQDRFRRAHAYYINNIGKINVPMGLGFATMGVAEKVDELFVKSLQKQGFTEKQIETIQKNKLLKFTSKRVKKPEEKERTRTSKSKFGVDLGGGGTRDIGMPKQKTKFDGTRDIGMPKQKTRIGVQPGGGGTRDIASTNQKSKFGVDLGGGGTRDITSDNQKGGRSINPNLIGRGLRSATDQIRYGGKMMFQGNPAGRAPGLSNYWSPDPKTAATYTNPGKGKGIPGTRPNPTGTITTARRPPGTPRVTRGLTGTPQFKFPKGSPPPSKMITQMADDAAVGIAKKTAATKASKLLGRAVPVAGAAIAVADAGIRASKGDYAGAVLSAVSAVPGPAGWAALAVQIATDAAGVTGGVKEQQEFDNYGDYIKGAAKIAKKDKIKIDRNAMLDLFLRELSKDNKLSNKDKEFLVAIFTDAEGLEKDDVITFVKKIQKKLMDGKSIEEELYPGQPSPNGFPDSPPPKMAPNGYHPEFGKRENRYRRLDPHSAESMPLTGDPKTDANVKKARNDVQKVRKLKNLIGKMKTSS